MAPLPPWMFFSSGAIVSLISLIFPNLKLFIIPGVLFLIIGLLKVLMIKRAIKHINPNHTYHTNVPDSNNEDVKKTKKCWVCGARNNYKSNFCGHCGHRLP